MKDIVQRFEQPDSIKAYLFEQAGGRPAQTQPEYVRSLPPRLISGFSRNR